MASVQSIVLFVERDTNSTTGEHLLRKWIEVILERNKTEKSKGLPSPYWSTEKTLTMLYGKLPPGETESFRGHSYSVHAALDMLVRRVCRQAVSGLWRKVSALTMCEYAPASGTEWFLWRSKKGDNRSLNFPLRGSWSQWRRDTATVNRAAFPAALLRHRDWIVPFALVYPHRAGRMLSATIDAIYGERASLV